MLVTQANRFGWITGDGPSSGAPWDEPVFESENFVAVPSLGSLVPGWLVVVPRMRMWNLSGLNDSARDELESAAVEITARYKRPGANWYAFEHGAGAAGSLTGCGVDQAHLHLVPLPFDLIDAAQEAREGGLAWGKVQRGRMLSDLPTTEYVGVSDAMWSRYLIGSVEQPISQWVRRVIAQKLKVYHRWDYRQHPETEAIQITLQETRLILRK